MLRYLEGNQYKHQESYDNIIRYHEFIGQQFPMNPSVIEKYIDALNKGVVYAYKRDKGFRPICVCMVKKLPEMGSDIDFFIGLSSFYSHFLMTRCLVPGKVENWTAIYDFTGVGLTSTMPKKLTKGLSKPMQDYFKGRLYRMYIVNA